MEDNHALLYRIAKAYYIDGKTQEEIAKEESFSRPKISRLLTRAKEIGMISFQIHEPPVEEKTNIEFDLCTRLHLKSAKIVDPTTDNVSFDIAKFAGTVLPYYLNGSKNVGVGWGYTMYQTAKLMPNYISTQQYNFIPLLGITGIDKPYSQINVIAYLFAEKTNSNSFFTTIPIMHKTGEETGEIESAAKRRLIEQWSNIDTAIIGLGAKPSNINQLIYEASDEYFNALYNSDVKGDVLSNFFFDDGSFLDVSQYYSQLSFPPSELKELNKVICIAGGINKVDALIIAAKKQFYNILITDRMTAKAMLSKC